MPYGGKIPADLIHKTTTGRNSVCVAKPIMKKGVCHLNTGCLTTDMNKVSAFFMEKTPYFIENFDHILFTIEVSFIIMPYLGEKLKGKGPIKKQNSRMRQNVTESLILHFVY